VPGPVVRLYLLQTHYRSPIDFSIEQVSRAKGAHARLGNFLRSVDALREAAAEPAPGEAVEALRDTLSRADAAFEAAQADDLNTARALGGLFDLVRRANVVLGAAAQRTASELALLRGCAALLRRRLDLLGITVDDTREAAQTGAAEPFVELLVEVRHAAREQRVWALADRVRQRLAELGVVLEDQADGTRWRWADVVEQQGDSRPREEPGETS